MLRYFLLFGIIAAIVCAIEPSVSGAALPGRLQLANVNWYPAELCSMRNQPFPCRAYTSLLGNAVRTDRGTGTSAWLPRLSVSKTPMYIASAWHTGVFDAPAGQGTDSGPVAGPVAGPVKQRGPRAVPGPQAPEDLSPPAESPKRLPFQGAAPTSTSPDAKSVSEKPEKPTEPTGVDGARKHLVEPSKEKAKRARTTRKKSAARQRRSERDAAEGKPGTNAPPTRRASQARQPVFDARNAPVPPVGSTHRGGLPPLPPALPYNPSFSRSSGAGTLTPRSDGTIMARIPSSGQMPGTGAGVPSPLTASPQGRISPQPLRPNNPISGFIMDSFGEPARPVPVQAPPVRVQTRGKAQPQQASQQTSQQGGPGIFGQLGSDVQQLGAGIKGVFERFVPSSR